MEQDDCASLEPWPGRVSSPGTGLRLGRALAADRRRIVVVTDMARSSLMMREALISGATSQGADVIDGGVAPEPAAAYAARMGDCAVFVKERGHESEYVVYNADGSPLTKEQTRHVKATYGKSPAPDYKGIGRRLEYGRAADDYADRMVSELGKAYKAPTVIDCRCGTASMVALKVIGPDVISINAHADAWPWSEEPPLDEDGVTSLKDLVGSKDGYIGACFDRSGSDAVLIDENCGMIDPSRAAAMTISCLKPKKVVASADASSLIENACANAEYIITPCDVGSVAERMTQEGADIGVCGSKLMYKGLPAPDPFRTVAILSELAYSNSLRNICQEMPQHYRREESLPIGDDEAAFIRGMNERTEEMQCVRRSTADGWRIDLEGGWFLVRRPSEGHVTVVAESTDKAYLIGLMGTASNLVRGGAHHQ